MSQNLAGKRAFVTGGSRGIGAAIVLRLAREGADPEAVVAMSKAGLVGLVKGLARVWVGVALPSTMCSRDRPILT